MGSDSLFFIIIAICLIMSAYFSATETAFLSLNRIRMKNMADKGNKRAALVLELEEKYDNLLSTILIGNNIVNILSSSLATILFVKMLGDAKGASVSTIVTTVLVLIFGEISPKSIAKESPDKFALFSAPIIAVLVKILTPVNFVFAQWKKLLSHIFKSEEEPGITEEELLTIVDEAQAGGGIGEDERVLIRSAIEFDELEAVDIYTPRIDIVGIPVDMPKDEIAKIFADTGYSRLPVYEENIDQIIGILYQKDFYNFIYRSDVTIRDSVRPVIFTPKNKKIDDLLRELQQKKLHIAVAMDEYGGTAGIITLEDILEELVGEIWDEHDKVETEIERISDNEYLVAGKTKVEKLFECLDREAEFDVQTVSGWVMELFECIPKAGDFHTDELVAFLQVEAGLLLQILTDVGDNALENWGTRTPVFLIPPKTLRAAAFWKAQPHKIRRVPAHKCADTARSENGWYLSSCPQSPDGLLQGGNQRGCCAVHKVLHSGKIRITVPDRYRGPAVW